VTISIRPTEAQRLSQVFDPVALAPGMYVIASSAPGYGLARALADEAIVAYVGERYATPTTKEMLFFVGRGERKGRAANPSVKVLIDSFANATDAYDDWKIKWWREAIQNGVDAGATTIRCEAHEQSDGTWLVSCEDNGRGMDRDTIENKLMAVGGTGKRGPGGGTVGGFGLAKNMLLFTWLDWEIRSRDSMIHGRGGEGSDFETIPAMKGTKITVRMPADKHTYDALAVTYIGLCDLPHVSFFVNGEPVKARLKGKKLLRDEPEFQLFHNQSQEKTSAILVRARGTQFQGSLFLFKMELDLEIVGEVIVDLLLPTIKILTDNRDGFNDTGGYWTKQKLTKFAKELTIEGKAALRAQKTMISQAFRGEGKFRAESSERESQAAAAVGATSGKPADLGRALADFLKLMGDNPAALADLVERQKAAKTAGSEEASPGPKRRSYGEPEAEVSVGSGGGFAMPMASSAAARIMVESIRGPTNVEAAIRQVVWRPDFFLHNEVPGYRVPKEFMPASMTPRAVKLLSVWTDLCRFVMMQLGCSKTFGVGFMFSTTSGAAALRAEGEDWLILNPFRDVEHQRMMLRPSNDEDLQWLYASAIHEATHLADGIEMHGIAFAYALTHNIAKCTKGWRVVKKIERATKLGVVAKTGAGGGAGGAEPRAKGRSKAEREAARVRKVHVEHAYRLLDDGLGGTAAQRELHLVEHFAGDAGVTEDEAWAIVEEARSERRRREELLVGWAYTQFRDGASASDRYKKHPSDVVDMLRYPAEYARDTKLPALVRAYYDYVARGEEGLPRSEADAIVDAAHMRWRENEPDDDD